MTTDELDELRRLLTVISPLPYWIEPATPTRLHGYNHTLDAYIACGTQGDPTDTFDVIERYEVDTDYTYLVAAANAVPALFSHIANLGSALAVAAARIEPVLHAARRLVDTSRRDLEDRMYELGLALEAYEETPVSLPARDPEERL